MSRPLLARIACLLALVLAGACGGPPPGEPSAAFPLRLLPQQQAVAVEPLLEDDFSDLSTWQVLDYHASKLSRAVGHPGVAYADGVVYLDDPGLCLVRLVELPADVGHSIIVRLGGEEPFEASARCPHVFLPLVQELEAGDTLEQIVASGKARTPAGRTVLVERMLPVRLQASAAMATWTAPPAADGFAQARFKHSPRPTTEVRALVFSAATGPVAITSLRIEPKPEILRLFDLASASTGAGSVTHPVVAPVRSAGEWRPSLVVPPGTTHELVADVPEGARSLTFGVTIDPSVCTEPELDPPPTSRWFVELSWEGQPALMLGQSGIQHPPQGPPVWQDIRLSWPVAPPAVGPVTVRFGVEGDAAVAFGQPMLRGAGNPRPNVLLVSLDTVRADHVGYQGYERPTTPSLDAFARDSVAFLNACSVGPYTLPTHVTMFTGLMPQHHGVTDGWADRLDAQRHPYLPKLLADAGWVTGGFTGGGFLSADFGFADGYDCYRPVDPVIHHESALNRRRYQRNEPLHVEAIERAAGVEGVARWIVDQQDTPWFAFVHTYAPHEYDPPADVFALFDSGPGSDWGTDAGEIARRLSPTAWPGHPPGPADVEHLRNLYDGALRFTDDKLGRLLAELRVRGLLENTIVVITSDHGEELFEHAGVRHSITLYEEMLRVPLVIRAPGCLPRQVRDAVTLADVTPTILALAGLPPVAVADGRSLADVVLGGSPSELGKPLLIGHVDTNFSRRSSLRIGRYKLIRGDVSTRVKFPAPALWELYDLAADPDETHNLAAEKSADVERMAAGLEALEASLRSQSVGGSAADLSPEAIEQLRQLGYLGDDS